MDFIRTIKSRALGLYRHVKNWKFRSALKKEKSQKYLFQSNTKTTREKIFSFQFEKRRFFYFNTAVSFFDQNKDRFRLSFVLIGSFLILASFYIVFLSPYFRISPSKVIIERIDSTTDINIAYKSVEDVYGESIFSIDKNAIAFKLHDLQKNIKTVDITRLFPNGLKIILESYGAEFVAVPENNTAKNYMITSNGILIYQKEKDPKMMTLEIRDPNLSEGAFLDYKQIASEPIMKRIILARDLFVKSFSAVNIAKLTYFRLERELHITLESGTHVIIRLGDDIDKQISMLQFYQENNKEILNSGEVFYVDVRVLWKLFICKDKNVCKKNLNKIYGDYYR